MFVILLKYTRSLAEVDRYLAEHRQYLQKHYAAGDFLLSGRQEPRTGGVIIAQAGSRAQVEAIVREDPFHRAQVAEYEIIEFCPTLTAPALQQFKATC